MLIEERAKIVLVVIFPNEWVIIIKRVLKSEKIHEKVVASEASKQILRKKSLKSA